MTHSSRTSSRRSPPLTWPLAAVLSATLAASLALAGSGLVKTRDGATFAGEISEANQMVIVKDKRGIETRIPRENVTSIELRQDPELEFNSRYKQLAEGDVEERVKLAQYAFEQRRPDLARRVLLEALAIDPNHPLATRLYDVAKSQIQLDRRATATPPLSPLASTQSPRPAAPPANPPAPAPSPPPAPPAAAAPPQTTARAERPLLTPEQINTIRQFEIREGETGVNFKFDNDVERRFAQARGLTVASLRQRTPLERFKLIRDSKDRDALADVKILRDPASLLEFRTKIQPRLLAGCASSGCHGGDDAGAFFLHNPATNEADTYTNFYVLATSRYPVTNAAGKRQQLRTVDRTTPEQSLLLQFSLPGDVGRFPHPPVPNFKPAFRSADNEGFRLLQSWILNTLSPIEPDYGFRFSINPSAPVPPAASQPTPTPALNTPPVNPPTTPR